MLFSISSFAILEVKLISISADFQGKIVFSIANKGSEILYKTVIAESISSGDFDELKKQSSSEFVDLYRVIPEAIKPNETTLVELKFNDGNIGFFGLECTLCTESGFNSCVQKNIYSTLLTFYSPNIGVGYAFISNLAATIVTLLLLIPDIFKIFVTLSITKITFCLSISIISDDIFLS